MNSMISKGVSLDFDRTTLFIGFFGCYCAFNRSMLDVDRCCWSISGWAVGAMAGGASGSIGRFVLTTLLMAWTIVVLQHFLNSWLGGEWWGLWVGGCFCWFGWDVAEGAVFVGDIGVGAEVVICPVTRKLQQIFEIPSPQLDGTIKPTGYKGLTIWTEIHARDTELLDFCSGDERTITFPQLDSSIVPPSYNDLPIWTKIRTPNSILDTSFPGFYRSDKRSIKFPELDVTVRSSGYKDLSIWTEAHARDTELRGLYSSDERAVASPELDSTVRSSGYEGLAIWTEIHSQDRALLGFYRGDKYRGDK
jgi:hypothetical protein